MSLLNKVNLKKDLEYDPVVKQGINNRGPDNIVGVFSTFTHSWLACGQKLFIINNSDGTIQCSWTFAENSADLVEITCAIEFQFEGCSIPLLIIGISSENTNKICFFNPNTRKIIRAIECSFPVRVLCIIEDGLNEVNPLNDALTHAEGLLAVGCADGSLYVLDLCRGMLEKALNGDFRYVSDEEEPAEVYSINVASVSSSLVLQKLEECYSKRSSLAVCLTEDCDEGVTALCYSYESAILYVGTGSGSFLLWNMTSLNCLLHSQSTSRAIISLSLLEPCDDPRHNLFLWICYENYSQAVMYCISFASKYYVQGYGVYYQGFESAGLVYRLALGQDENLTAIRPVNSLAIAKSITKNLTKSFSISDSECTQLRLFVTSYEVMLQGVVRSRMVVFDLNQWYKEQMPDEGPSSCIESIDLCCEGLWYLAVDYSTLSHYQWVRPLEQHFHPSAFDFQLWCIEDNGIRCLEKLGLQSQWLENMKIVGPSVLLNPQQVFHGAISAGLLPTFIDPPDPEFATVEEERAYVLTVCLENRATSVIEHCAQEWATGSHPVAGCTLAFLIDWLWDLHGVYKSNGNRMCVPLFDQSGLRFYVSERKALQHCKSLLVIVQNLYLNIIRKYSTFVLTDGLDHKLAAMSLVRFYFDCCLKLISVNLLPEPNEAGRPADSIAYKYDEINLFVSKKRKLGPFLGDMLVGQCGGEREWVDEGGNGKYPPPSIQAVLRYCLHPSPSLWNKLSLLLYLYIDIVNTYTPLRNQESIDKVKNFQYLLRIPDVQYKIVTAFWYLDHNLFFEGTSLLMDQKILPVDLTDDQHRSILKLLSLQGQEKLALQYLRLKSSDLHQLDDFRLELDLLLSNRLINEAFMFQRKHPEHREELLTLFFQGCIKKKLLGHVFGLHLDPKEESVLLKFLKTSDLKNKGDLQVLLLLSRAKYTEAVSLNDRLNSMICGPKSRLETDTRDMVVRGITGGLNSLSKEMAIENRRYKPPPPGTCPKPLSALIKIRSEPDGPLLQTDCRALLSEATKSARHLSDFVNVDDKKVRKRAHDDENMDIDLDYPPRKRPAIWGPGNEIVRELGSVFGSAWSMTPQKSVSQQERQVMELVGTPLVKKRGKKISPQSKPSSILKGKSSDDRGFMDDLPDTPSRKMLRFALPDSEKSSGNREPHFNQDVESSESKNINSTRVRGRKSLRELVVTEEEEEHDNSAVIESIKNRLRSSKNKLLCDGGVDWRNLAEESKPKTLFTPGLIGKAPNNQKRTPRGNVSKAEHFTETPQQSGPAMLDITVTSSERKYLQSPSREAEESPVTEAVFNTTVPKRLFENYKDPGNLEDNLNVFNEKNPPQQSFIERYKMLRNQNSSSKFVIGSVEIKEHKDDFSEKSLNNVNESQETGYNSLIQSTTARSLVQHRKDMNKIKNKELAKSLHNQHLHVQENQVQLDNDGEIYCVRDRQFIEESKFEDKEIGDIRNSEGINEMPEVIGKVEVQRPATDPVLLLSVSIDQETFDNLSKTQEIKDESNSFSPESLATEKTLDTMPETPKNEPICLSSDEDKISENKCSFQNSEEDYSIESTEYDGGIDADLECEMLGISRTKKTVGLDFDEDEESMSSGTTFRHADQCTKAEKKTESFKEGKENPNISELLFEENLETSVTDISVKTTNKTSFEAGKKKDSLSYGNEKNSANVVSEPKENANISNELVHENLDENNQSSSFDESSIDNAVGEVGSENETENQKKKFQNIDEDVTTSDVSDVILINSDEDDDVVSSDSVGESGSIEVEEEDIYASENSPLEIASDYSENDEFDDVANMVSDPFLPSIVPIKIASKYEKKCGKNSAENLKTSEDEKLSGPSNSSHSSNDSSSPGVTENVTQELPQTEVNIESSATKHEFIHSLETEHESSSVDKNTFCISVDDNFNAKPDSRPLVNEEHFTDNKKRDSLSSKENKNDSIGDQKSDFKTPDENKTSCLVEFTESVKKLQDDTKEKSEIAITSLDNFSPKNMEKSCSASMESQQSLKVNNDDELRSVYVESALAKEQQNLMTCGSSLDQGKEQSLGVLDQIEQTSVDAQNIKNSEDILGKLTMRVAETKTDLLKKKSRLENVVAEITDRMGVVSSPSACNEKPSDLTEKDKSSENNCAIESIIKSHGVHVVPDMKNNPDSVRNSTEAHLDFKMDSNEPKGYEIEKNNTTPIDSVGHINSTLLPDSSSKSNPTVEEDTKVTIESLSENECKINTFLQMGDVSSTTENQEHSKSQNPLVGSVSDEIIVTSHKESASSTISKELDLSVLVNDSTGEGTVKSDRTQYFTSDNLPANKNAINQDKIEAISSEKNLPHLTLSDVPQNTKIHDNSYECVSNPGVEIDNKLNTSNKPLTCEIISSNVKNEIENKLFNISEPYINKDIFSNPKKEANDIVINKDKLNVSEFVPCALKNELEELKDNSKSDTSEVTIVEKELEVKIIVDSASCSKNSPKKLIMSVPTSIEPEQPEKETLTDLSLTSDKNGSIERSTESSKFSFGELKSNETPSGSSIEPSKVQFQSFFFGRDEKSETYFRTTAKATFQVGSRASLPSEDEPVNPMETAVIETVEEENVEDEEDTDPRNTCMLDIDLSLHLSEDEEIGNLKPKMVDKSILTTDSYLVQKARRSSRNSGSKEVKISKFNKEATNDSHIQKDDKKKLPALIPIVSEKLEIPEDAAGKHSFGTQTCVQLTENVSEENKEYNNKISSLSLDMTKKSNLPETCNSKENREKNVVNIQISSSRSENKLKGILKNTCVQSSETSNECVVKYSDYGAKQFSKHSDLVTHRPSSSSCKMTHGEKSSEGLGISVDGMSSCSNKCTVDSVCNKKSSNDLLDCPENSKKEKEPILHGILKNPLLKKDTQTSDEVKDKIKRHSEDHSVEKQKRSRRSVVRSSSNSQDPELHGILKNKRRGSCSSENASDIRKRLEEDFPEVKRKLRGHSEEPEFHGILKKSEGHHRHSRKSFIAFESAKQLQAQFEEDNEEKILNIKKSRKSADEHSEVRRSRRHSVGSYCSNTNVDVQKRNKRHSTASLFEDKRRNTRVSEEPKLIKGILKNNEQNKISQNSEADSDLKLHLQEDFPVEIKRRRRYSVESDSPVINKNKLEKRRCHSSASDIIKGHKFSFMSNSSSDCVNEDCKSLSDSDKLKSMKPLPELEVLNVERNVNEKHLIPSRRSTRRSSILSSSSDISDQMDLDIGIVKPAKHIKGRSSSEKSQEHRRSSLEVSPENKTKSSNPGKTKNPEKESSCKRLDYSEEIVPIIPKKSKSLQDFPIRRGTRLHPILEDIKEEEEGTPKKKRRSLDDIEAQKMKKENKPRKKKGAFSPLVVDNSDDDNEAGTPVKQVWTPEMYSKERRLTRTQKKVLIKNLSLVEVASPTTSAPPLSETSSPILRKQGRKKTPIPESPVKTPSRTSLRLQKKPPNESDWSP